MKKSSGIFLSAFALFSSSVLALPPYVPGQIIVSGESVSFENYDVVEQSSLTGNRLLKVAPGRELGLVQSLRKKGLKAGLNYIAETSEVPTDLYYQYQWHFPAIKLESAWDVSKGMGITVAVLDTGLVLNLPDGLNCITSGYNFVGANSSDPTDGSSLSHGMHVAGTIAQETAFSPETDNGVAGVAPEACIMPVKVLDDSGSGTFFDIAEGIRYAVDNGADIINMSLGVDARYGLMNDLTIDEQLDYAEENGVLVVAAAGNDGYRNNVSYPAIYPSVLSVGATDALNKVTRYSNRGYGLDLVAPGGDTSRDRDRDGFVDGVLQETVSNGNSNYYFLQGTSMASPHVAGVAALLLAKIRESNAAYPAPSAITQLNTDIKDFRDQLISSTLDLGDVGKDSDYGNGLIQADLALGLGGGQVGQPPEEPGNGDCIPTAANEKGPRASDGIDNDCNGVIDG